MSVNLLKTRPWSLQALKGLQRCCYATKPSDILGDIEVEEVPVYDVEPKYTQEELDRIRNKSRLAPQHQKILNDKAPYEESQEHYHDWVWYRRQILGRYGMNSTMANPKYCWPTKEEVEDIKEYERVLYPHTIQEVWQQIEEKKKQDALEIKQREEEIDSVVKNFDKWRTALQAKMEKKEAELLAAKQKKEALLEEVREHFGFRIDPRDERFQEMLAQKEKEDKKKKKEAKKKLKAEKMMAMIAKHEEAAKAQKAEEMKAQENKSKQAAKETVEAKGEVSPKGKDEKTE